MIDESGRSPAVRTRAGIEDVAAGAGVSVATVSRAIRGLPNVAKATRERVLAVAAELRYQPHPAAARLAAGSTKTIAVGVPDPATWFFAKIAGGMLLILGIGLAIGPAVASLIMGAWHPVGLFLVTATFHGALAGAAYLRMRVRKSVDAAERAPFQAMSDKQVTPETFVLDPRADSEADEFVAGGEDPVPEELIETTEDDGDVQNGKV